MYRKFKSARLWSDNKKIENHAEFHIQNVIFWMIYCLKHTEIKGTASKKYNGKITWGSGSEDYQITSLSMFYHDFKSGIVKVNPHRQFNWWTKLLFEAKICPKRHDTLDKVTLPHLYIVFDATLPKLHLHHVKALKFGRWAISSTNSISARTCCESSYFQPRTW